MYKDLLSKMAGKNEYMVVDRLGRCVAFANKHNQSGFARPRLAVTTPDQKNEIIVIVDSEVDIWPALRAYYERNRPEWRLQSDNVYFLACATAVGHQRKIYVKGTLSGLLYVYEISPKRWVAYRGEPKCELMFGDKIAVFKTPEEAQRTADAHLQDGYPNSAIINDGYRWLLIPMPVRWGKRKK